MILQARSSEIALAILISHVSVVTGYPGDFTYPGRSSLPSSPSDQGRDTR